MCTYPFFFSDDSEECPFLVIVGDFKYKTSVLEATIERKAAKNEFIFKNSAKIIYLF